MNTQKFLAALLAGLLTAPVLAGVFSVRLVAASAIAMLLIAYNAL